MQDHAAWALSRYSPFVAGGQVPRTMHYGSQAIYYRALLGKLCDFRNNLITLGLNNITQNACAKHRNSLHEAIHCTKYFANRLLGVVMALNSRLLPLGSLKNMVHCSPGLP